MIGNISFPRSDIAAKDLKVQPGHRRKLRTRTLFQGVPVFIYRVPRGSIVDPIFMISMLRSHKVGMDEVRARHPGNCRQGSFGWASGHQHWGVSGFGLHRRRMGTSLTGRAATSSGRWVVRIPSATIYTDFGGLARNLFAR